MKVLDRFPYACMSSLHPSVSQYFFYGVISFVSFYEYNRRDHYSLPRLVYELIGKSWKAIPQTTACWMTCYVVLREAGFGVAFGWLFERMFLFMRVILTLRRLFSGSMGQARKNKIEDTLDDCCFSKTLQVRCNNTCLSLKCTRE